MITPLDLQNRKGYNVPLIKLFSFSGLTLILNAEQDEYIPFVTDSAGFIVTVHIPDETPYEREEGIRVSAGFSTEIAVVMVRSNDSS